MNPPDVATIQTLRSDLAMQIARCLRKRGVRQASAARELGIPQPTLSKVMNGSVSALSLELLIRIAVRLKLPVVLQLGKVPEEAGVFVPREPGTPTVGAHSRLAEEARSKLLQGVRHLIPEERLEAQLRHSELVTSLHRAAASHRRSR